MEQVSHDEYRGRCALVDDRLKRGNERLNKLEDAFALARKLDIKLGLIVERLEKSQDETDDRLSALEQKPAKRWELVVSTTLTLIAGVVIGIIVRAANIG